MRPSIKLIYLQNTGLELYFTFQFFTIDLFLRNLQGVKLGGHKSQKEVNQLKIEKCTYICIFFGTNTHLILLVMQNIDLDLYSTFLACLSQAFFEESIEGQTRGSKKVKFVKYNQGSIVYIHRHMIYLRSSHGVTIQPQTLFKFLLLFDSALVIHDRSGLHSAKSIFFSFQ